MDFKLSEEQLMLQAMVKDFTKTEIEPVALKIDSEGSVPDDLIHKMSQIGLLGMTVPREYGGSGAGNLACALACEQIAYSGTGAWWLAAFNNSIPECIVRFGSPELKAIYLPKVCEGKSYSSIQFTEEDTGSDPEALKTTAVPDGDDYIINGMKRFSTFGARDGYAVLYAKDETGKCTAFVIDKNVKGYTTGKVWDLMGGGGIEAVDVYLQDLRVPGTHILGRKGDGFNILLHWIAAEKITQCAACVGIAQAALDEAVKYTRTRISRGKPISALQGIRWMLADMYVKLQAARWMTYRTAYLQDTGDPDWMTEAAAAKVFVIPAAMEIVETARRIHGGYGYTREFKIERLYRAVAGASAVAVSLEINKSMIGAFLLK
jgi:alkylation response protein AidB-like acyl-CoA dehydrogenase